jgi:hypothetical protein
VMGVHVDQVVEDISVRPSLSAEAVALEIPAGAPVLLVERAHRAGRRVVEVGEVVIAADRFRLRYRIPVAPGDQHGGDQHGGDQHGGDQHGGDQDRADAGLAVGAVLA